MLKKLLYCLLFIFLLSVKDTNAQNFIVDVKVEYILDENGSTKSIYSVTIENGISELLASSYVLNLHSIEPYNLKVYDDVGELKHDLAKVDGVNKVNIVFDKPVIGKGNKKTFVLEYFEDNFAVKSGEIWEIAVPRLTDKDSFRNYDVYLTIPESFGNEAYISPSALNVKKENGFSTYYFSKDIVKKTGISAGFGEFQVFTFSLNYHLENPLNSSSLTEIAIPPDTSTQKVYYQSLDPTPLNIINDEDGNWIAVYNLKPRERVDVAVKGSVQIFSTPHQMLAPYPGNLLKNTRATKYWQSDDPEIVKLASNLKTPESIYDFVVKTLSYDYGKVQPNIGRLGAKEALNNPKSVICMEFTDLFIAISRAAGIPAREINGYAYTENPSIQPLSLVADVLHSWPEYWNDEKRVWVPVDPTWGHTTRGVDYFNKLDLRHFAFVLHGIDDSKPYPPGSYKLGPNPEKDVYVSFGILPDKRYGDTHLSFKKKTSIELFSETYLISVKNTGNAALYMVNPQIMYNAEVVETKQQSLIPPFGSYTFTINVPKGLLGTKSPEQVAVVANDKIVVIPNNKQKAIVLQLTAISLMLIGIITLALYKSHKLNFVKGIIKLNENKKRRNSNKENH